MKKFFVLILISVSLMGCTPKNKTVCKFEDGTTSASLDVYTDGEYIDYAVLTYSDYSGIAADQEYNEEMCSFLSTFVTECKIQSNDDVTTLTVKIKKDDGIFEIIFSDIMDEEGRVKYEDGIKVIEELNFTCE